MLKQTSGLYNSKFTKTYVIYAVLNRSIQGGGVYTTVFFRKLSRKNTKMKIMLVDYLKLSFEYNPK